jgi:DNA-binding NtrC family response regulator
MREVTRKALEIGGCRVLGGRLEAATRIASDPSAKIDLRLTDVVMPGMSGPEWARSISALRAGLVTVFMTGYAENDTLRAALQGVAWKYVQKPFTVGSLLAQVGEALASRWRGPDRLRDPQFSSGSVSSAKTLGFDRLLTVDRKPGQPPFPVGWQGRRGIRECNFGLERIDFVKGFVRQLTRA